MKNSFIELFEKCSPELKDLALTHSSFAHQHGVSSNERVEFLGDSVLSTIVTDYLYKHCKDNEGKLTKIRSKFVCTENLSELAKRLNIQSRIRFGKSFKDEISDVLLTLTEREEKVIRLRYGLDDNYPRTLEEVGREFGVTRERIRQIENKALNRLRQPSRLKRFEQYRV